MRALVLRFASEQNLVQITHTAGPNLGLWEMAGLVRQSYRRTGAPPVGPIRLRSTAIDTTERINATGSEFGLPFARFFSRETAPTLEDSRFLMSSWFTGYDQPARPQTVSTGGPGTPAGTVIPGFTPPTDSEMREVFAAMQQLEDPSVHTPFTTTCASCHLAGTSMRWADEYFVGRAGRQDSRPLLPSARPSTLQRSAAVVAADVEPSNMRMLGYSSQGTPTLTVRVLNETNDILAFLNATQ